MIFSRYFTLSEINSMSYFDFSMYVKLIYNKEEALQKLQDGE